MSDYDDATVEAIRETALKVVRGRKHPIDRKLLLVAVRRSLNLRLTKRQFRSIMAGYLMVEQKQDQRGRTMSLTLDLPERVLLRRAIREEAKRHAREEP